MNLLVLIPVIVGIAGCCADAWTTYWGLYILKQDTEGDQNWFAQFETGTKFRCLTIKPALGIALGAAVVFGLRGEHIIQLVGAALLAALGIRGLIAGIHNWKINIAQSGGKL
jgi:hypothetical protein